MAYRIYISPSLQPWNKYADGSGSEQDHMQAVGKRVVELLKQHKEFVVFTNRPGMTLQKAVKESNNLAVHAHVAIHSNAGGGEGTEVWIVKKGYNAEKFAKAIYKYLAPLSPGEDRGVKATTGLYEVRETKAPAVIIEVEFHDSAKLAAWIGQHHEELAQAIYWGICDYFEVAPIKPQPTDVKQVKVHAGDKVYSGELRDGKTMVHVRVLEEFGLKIHWDGKEVWVSSLKPQTPFFTTKDNYDVITCSPEYIEVRIIKNKLPFNRNGINGGFFSSTLTPLGTVIIDGNVVTERVLRVPYRPCLAITKNNHAAIVYLAGTKEEAKFYKYVVGGGPVLVLFDGVKGPVLYPEVGADEGFQEDILKSIRPRTAVGVTPSGLVKLVTTESMSIEQLAKTMHEIGCINAMALDGGGSTAMTWQGKVIRGNKRAVSTAIFVKE